MIKSTAEVILNVRLGKTDITAKEVSDKTGAKGYMNTDLTSSLVFGTKDFMDSMDTKSSMDHGEFCDFFCNFFILLI